MVRDVFDSARVNQLIGFQGVGHVRYPTAGSFDMSEAQPFYVNSPYGIVLAHNGNLTNDKELRSYLDSVAHRHINTSSDSELLLNILADELNQSGKKRVNQDDVFKAVGSVMQKCKGGFACVGMIAGFGIFGFRDPHGIRPIVYGKRLNSSGKEYDYMFASESVVLDALGYKDIVDVQPGETVMITSDGVSTSKFTSDYKFTPCVFEYVYFARPDSIMNGISVYKARLAMGEALAAKIKRTLGDKNDIDVVIPIPDTSRVAALELSYHLNIVYREGFIKNRYIGRTFIMPGQEMRIKSVRRKLNPMPMEFSGKNVLLVDDSIVRGTTSKEIVSMAKECGANKVYFASCAPAIRYPNVYGIDMPTSSELVAHQKSDEEIAAYIGADKLIYQDLEDLTQACRKFNPDIKSFEVSVFTGQYVTGGVNQDYLKELEQNRSLSRNNRTSLTNIGGSQLNSPADATDNETVGLFNNFYRK